MFNIGSASQGSYTDYSKGSTAPVTTQVSGSGFIVFVTSASSYVPVITDTFSNTYTPVVSGYQLSSTNTGQTRFVHLFYCAKGTGGANHIITATYDSDYPSVMMTEVITGGNGNGIALDSFSTVATSTSPFTGTAVATAVAGGLVFSFIGVNSYAATITCTPSTGYTKVNELTSLGYVVGATSYTRASTIGSYSGSWTASGTVDTAVLMAAFKPA